MRLLSQTMKATPNSADRIIDAAALLMVVGGISLFGFARSALTGIGDGTRATPQGMSAVTVAEFHVAQSTMGLWIVGIGVVVGCVAALRHKLRNRVEV